MLQGVCFCFAVNGVWCLFQGIRRKFNFYTPGKKYPSPCAEKAVNTSCTVQPKYKHSYLVDLKLGDN